MNNYPDDFTYEQQRKYFHDDEFLCRRCQCWTPNVDESSETAICNNCFGEVNDESFESWKKTQEVIRRKSKKPKYVIDLSEIRKQMEDNKSGKKLF